MKIGFDNEKYLKMQSEHIRDRISKFDNKLYLEFGGKLFDDYQKVNTHKMILHTFIDTTFDELDGLRIDKNK